MLSKMPSLNCILADLSRPMLDETFGRVSKHTNSEVKIIQSDIRAAELKENHFDIILAGAGLHYKLLSPGGCLMISDLIIRDNELLAEYMLKRYENYLEKVGGAEYIRKVFDYFAREDAPRSINYQLYLMKKVGFKNVEIMHKNMCFGTFGAVK
jgi:tRNA (cmo5U34)-methyltransferase